MLIAHAVFIPHVHVVGKNLEALPPLGLMTKNSNINGFQQNI